MNSSLTGFATLSTKLSMSREPYSPVSQSWIIKQQKWCWMQRPEWKWWSSLSSQASRGASTWMDIGEMIATIILLPAFDEAIYLTELDLPAAVPLEGFVGALLGNQVSSTVASCMKRDAQMDTIWKNGLVFCNHFVRLKSALAKGTLKLAFSRGTAMFLPDDFPGADILIPVKYLDKQMSFFATKVKSKKRDTWKKLQAETDSSLQDAATALNLSTPYIGMTMALRQDITNIDIGQTFDILQPENQGCSTRYNTNTNYKWRPRISGLCFYVLAWIKIYTQQPQGVANVKVKTLKQSLLGYKAGMSLPKNADQLYASRLKPLG